MKRTVFFLLLAISWKVFSQDISDLTPEQQKVFIQNSLTVEPVEISSSFMGRGKKVTDWYALRGSSRMSKYEFLEFTGFEREAKIIEKTDQTNRSNQRLAWLMAVFGAGLIAWGALSPNEDNPAIPFLQWGGGSSLLLTSIVVATTIKEPEIDMSFTKAKMIADQYNEKLKNDLKEGKFKVKMD